MQPKGVPLLVLLVAATASVASTSRFELIKERKAKEQLAAQQVKDKLLLIGKTFSAQQVEQIFDSIQLEPTNCQQLEFLADTISELPAQVTSVRRYLEKAQTLLSDYCKEIESTLADNFFSLANSPELVDDLFAKKLIPKSEKELLEVERGEIKVDQLDLKQAAHFLSKSGADEISLNKLIRVSSIVGANTCQPVEELPFILNLTIKSLIGDWKPVKFCLQNLVASQIKLCESGANHLELVHSLKSRISPEVGEQVAVLGRELSKVGRFEKRFGGQVVDLSSNLFGQVVGVIDGLGLNLKVGEIYSSFGKKLGQTCAIVRRQFRQDVNVLRVFFGKTKLDELREWLLAVEACFYVPDYLDDGLKINDSTELKLDENHDLIVQLGAALGYRGNSYESSRKNLASESSFVKVFGERLHSYYCKLHESEGDAISERFAKVRANYETAILNNCAKWWPTRKAVLWMSRSGYPFRGTAREYLSQFVVVQKTCETLDSIDFTALRQKLNGPPECGKVSLLDRLMGGVSLLRNNAT